MPVGAILTVAELQELTGRRTRRGVKEILARERVPFVVAADGWPRVHEAALLGDGVVRMPSRDEREPDLDAIAS